MTPAKEITLDQILALDLDQVPVDPEKSYEMTGVLSFGRGLFEKDSVSGAATSYKTFYRLHQGQLVLSQLFGWEGALSLVDSNYAGRFVSSQFPTFKLTANQVLPRYLHWCTLRPELWDQLKAKAKGMGDRRRTLNPRALLSSSIPLPPVPAQEHIVSIMEDVSRLVELREQTANQVILEQKALVRAAFSKVTRDVKRVPLEELAPLVRRSVTIDPDTTYTELGVRSFYKGVFHRRELSGSEFTWQKLFWIREGDIVFSNLMAWEQAIAVATNRDDGCVGNHRILTCEPVRGACMSSFIHYFFQTKEGFDQILQASPGSIARNRTLSSLMLRKLLVPRPSLDAQEWFSSIYGKAEDLAFRSREAGQEISNLLPAVFEHALHGLRVPVAAALK